MFQNYHQILHNKLQDIRNFLSILFKIENVIFIMGSESGGDEKGKGVQKINDRYHNQ